MQCFKHVAKIYSMMFKQLPTMISELNKLGIALKALDGMNLATVGVNTGNLDAFRSAIKCLSTEQAVFALASKGATEEQIRQILITKQSEAADVEAALAKAGLTTATSALTQAEMVELATKTGVAKADAEALLSKIGITAAEEGQVAVKHQVTMAMLEQAVANGTLTSAESAQIATMLGLNAAETANIGITNILTGAVAKLWAVITAHPIGAILTAVGAVAIGVIAYINKSNKDAQKTIVETHEKAQQALDDTKNALSDDKSELESVNSELDSTKQKIQDIASQGTITLTEQNELDKLSTANTQLETQKSLLENNIKLKQKSAALDAKNLLGTQVEMNYSDIQDDKDIVSHKESYTYAEHTEYEASSLKKAYNIYMSALKTGNAEKQKLAQELIDKAGGDTAELTSSLLEIVESFKYDDGTIIEGYEDLYNQYMGLIYNLQSLTNPEMFLDIARQVTEGTNVDYEKAISDGYAMAYDGEFDIDKLNQDFVKALADNGIDTSTIEYIFKLKQQEYQSVVDNINKKYNPDNVLRPTYLTEPGHVDTKEETAQKELDNQSYEKQKQEVQNINDELTEYAKEHPIEFQLISSYDENFSTLDKYIEEEKLKSESAIQDTKSQLEDLSKNGNVDLTIRPVIDSSAMQAAGWDVEDGSIATTFTQGEFIWQGDEENGQYVYVHYTPILPDGTVLTPDQLSDYLYGTLEGSQNILDADNKGLVLKVDTDLQGISEDDIKALQEDRKQSAKMSNFLNQMGQWDDSLHDVQEGYYLTGDSVDYVDNAVNRLVEDAKKAKGEIPNEAPISFTETLAKVQSLSEGLDQLEKIYQDVLDKEDFDWSNILNNDKFTETFGNMENVTREYKNAYTDFIKTVSNSPDDIKGCQEAFNKLATAYINDSDALKNVTEETRDSVVNMLKDMNIVNADELVDSRLAEKTLEAKTATVDFANATKEELSSLIDYANQLGLTSAEVAQLCLDQIDVTNNPIDASASLKNLQTLILKAGVTGEKLGYLLKMVRAINTVTLAVQDGTATDSQITAAERLVDTLKSKMAEVSTANIEAEVDYKPKAKETKSKSDSEKDFDWIERKIKALESQISSLDKIIDSAYSSTTEKNNALIKQIDLINQEIELQQKAYEGYMAKANAVGLSDNYKELVQNGSIDIETITDKDLQEAISNYQSYYDSAQECLDKINELHENALDKHVECHDNELSDLKDMLDNQSITEKQYIDEMYRLWGKYYDGQVELAEKAKQQKLEILNEEKSWLESVGNAAIALLDDQVDKLEDQKDKATKIYQDQIDALNAQKKPLEYELELMERQKDAADKQLQYQKALYALRCAEQQRENYTYTSDKGFIYKADDQTIKDAKKDVSDAEYELLKLNIQQQIDAIDDQIDHLNDLIDQTEAYYDTQIDGLNTYKEEWQKAIDMEELATNMQTFIDKFGTDGLQRLFSEDMSLITNWKQSYLDNMAEIDVESTGTIGNLTKKFQELSGLAISPTITAMTDFEQAITDVNSKINGGGSPDNKEQSTNGGQSQGGQTQGSGSDNLVGAMGELSDAALNEDTGIPAQTQAWTDMLDPLQEVSDKLNDIELTLENLNGKTFSINVEFKSSGASGSANANGNFTGAVIRSGAAFASGTLGASKDETALLGELGNELVVRGNRFFTVGKNGAEMFNIKKGDIIFNHQQTKDLLDKGCAMGHGVAYAEGNAGRVTMTAGIRPFRPGDPTYDMMQQFKTCYSNNVDALNLNTNALNQRHEDFMRQVQNISNSVVNRQQAVTQTINVSLPNITDSSTAQDIMRDLSQISQRAIQKQWR